MILKWPSGTPLRNPKFNPKFNNFLGKRLNFGFICDPQMAILVRSDPNIAVRTIRGRRWRRPIRSGRITGWSGPLQIFGWQKIRISLTTRKFSWGNFSSTSWAIAAARSLVSLSIVRWRSLQIVLNKFQKFQIICWKLDEKQWIRDKSSKITATCHFRFDYKKK